MHGAAASTKLTRPDRRRGPPFRPHPPV